MAGNSGGPVILKPAVPFRSRKHKGSPKTAYVIGVVASVELQQPEYAIWNYRMGQYPERPYDSLRECIHLGRVIPMEYVMETIELS